MSLSRSENFNASERQDYGKRVSTSGESVHEVPGNVEFSAPLETSTPLEAPRQVNLAAARSSVSPPLNVPPAQIAATDNQMVVQSDRSDLSTDALSQPSLPEPLVPNPDVQSEAIAETSSLPASIVSTAIIPLLEERLVVDRRRRKVGEVVVRKEIETYMVEVPVRREKLIVEQVSPEYKQLAVVDLGKAQAQQDDLADASLSQNASARFTSADAAIEFIEAIAADSSTALASVHVSIALVDETAQAAYQQWLKQLST